MRPLARAAALLALLVLAALLSAQELAPGTYRKLATEETIARWLRDHETKAALMPPPPPAPPPVAPSHPAAEDFRGTFRFGPYDYDLVIEQQGERVAFRSGGVDRQDIGGAFETIGLGYVREGRVHARWWCLDLSRNYANNGGAELWFHEGSRDRLYVRYYHDADEKIEEGYGVRVGTHEGEMQHYRIRVPHPVKEFPEGLTLRGRVRGRDGEAIEGAVVMLRHEEATAVRSDGAGRWEIVVSKLPTVQMVSAAAPGYRIGVDAILKHEVREIDFVLDPSPWTDDPRYEFQSPRPDKGREVFRCGNCHRNSYDEWRASRHAVAATNEVTKAVYRQDFLPALAAGRARGDEGLCAACHAPQAALDGNVARLDGVTGVALEGNHCDLCHKVHHTERIDAPGVRGSLVLGRPNPFDAGVPGPIKRVYGALPDSDYVLMGPTHNPFFGTSALCAGCHQYTTPEGLPALDTYAEWSAWAADRPEHESCQHCHMPTGTSKEGKNPAKRVAINALRRPQGQIHDHSFLGRELAPGAVRLAVAAAVRDGAVHVRTTVTPLGVGHRFPTGSADKHLLLVVLAVDDAGEGAPLLEGPRLPGHAGLGEAGASLAARLKRGDLGGLPGREFAQVFADRDGATHVPFWRAERLVEDTRLRPGEAAEVRHAFDAEGAVAPRRVRVELWHRLRFKSHDVAAAATGVGVRPLDLLLAQEVMELPR